MLAWFKARRREARTRKTLLVMRLTDMTLVHPQMDSKRACSKCYETVGIYPSGQVYIARFGARNIDIVCQRCHVFNGRETATPQALAESAESIPADAWRHR